MTEDVVADYPCPACRTPADLRRGCPGCGRGPDPAAAEVVRLNAEIATLVEREQRSRHALAEVLRQLVDTRRRRDLLAAQVRTTTLATSVPPPPQVPSRDHELAVMITPGSGAPVHDQLAGAGTAGTPSTRAGGRQPEVSSFGVQTLLFVIGGLLLGTGAIVFMVVAWTRFGLVGQAGTLLAGTGLALAAPVLARWRRLRGTAETLAVIGVLMVLLDGYAAWRGGLVSEMAGTTWAAVVCAGTALIGLGYGRWARLASPQFAALVLAQPVLPLLAVEPARQLPGPVYWLAIAGYLAAVLAAGNLLLVRRLRRARSGPEPRTALEVAVVLGWVAVAGWLIAGMLLALLALLAASAVGPAATAGGAVLAGAVVFAAVARFAGGGGWSVAAATGLVLAATLALGRVLIAGWPGYALVIVATVVTAVGLAALRVPAGPVRRGWRIGALVGLGAIAGYAATLTGWVAAETVWRAWNRPAALTVTGLADWQLPVALGLLSVAAIGLLPRYRTLLAILGGTLLTLAVPPALALPWWAPVAVALPVAAGLAWVGASVVTARQVATAGAAAGLLVGHALLVGAASVASTAVVLAALVLVGLAVAVRARTGGEVSPARQVIGQIGLLVGLISWPVAVAAVTATAGAAMPWPGRAAVVAAAALLLAALLVRRLLPGYRTAAAAAVHVITPVAVVAGFAEGGLAVIGYAAGAAVVLAALGLVRPPESALSWLAPRLPVVALTVLLAAPQLAVVLLGPYRWLDNAWSGAPAGVGLTVAGDWPAAPAVTWGLLLLTGAAGIAGWVWPGGSVARWRSGLVAALLVAPVTLLVALAELGARWPVVPAVSLLLGAAALTWAACWLGQPGWQLAGAGYGLVLLGAGLAGSLPTRWSTMAALGLGVVVATVVAVAGRSATARVVGRLSAVTMGVLLAVTAAVAADASLSVAGLGVLAVAGLTLAASALGRADGVTAVASFGEGGAAIAAGVPVRRPTSMERLTTEAAAHAAAVVALLLSIAAPAQAAVVAILWGVALGLRALRRAESVGGRLTRVVAATGCQLLAWWLLLLWWQVVAVEAYTLPAALLALVAGGWVRRLRPSVGSWLAYSPALVAAVLPTLALSLVDPAPARRLLLGVAALVILLAGARRRLQALVVVGGGLAGLVAVRELVLVSQQLDAWIPLTVAGLLLVGLAATYERRRRDLARLRTALRQLA